MMFRFIFICAYIAFFNSQSQDYMFVATDVLNVRRGPGTTYEVIEQVTRNQQVFVLGSNNGWSKVLTPQNKEGYVSTQYLSNIKTSTKTEAKEKEDWYLELFIIGCVIIYFTKSIKKILSHFSGETKGKHDQKPKKSTPPKIEQQQNVNVNHEKKRPRIAYIRERADSSIIISGENGQTLLARSLLKHEELIGYSENFYIVKKNQNRLYIFDAEGSQLGNIFLHQGEEFLDCRSKEVRTIIRSLVSDIRVYNEKGELINRFRK